jgi:maltooligosyltrehalose trehalohydrolase
MNPRRVWAPFAESVALVTEGQRFEMIKDETGWWSARIADDIARADYAFSIDGGEPVPDPRSPSQPNGVFGYSRPLDHSAFQWSDAEWRQPPLASSIIYECHVGTFTEDGTFDAFADRLPYLKDLGITHLELMPVAEFPGNHGWGYDGVDLFAPHHAYGGPDGLKRMVNACHHAGLAVILDVVYNHLGPSGNFLQKFGPYLTDRYHTPWGDAVNFDGENSGEVRRFLCDNALMWLRDYHIDALRLDAVHAIFDSSAIHFLEMLASEVRSLASHLGRPLFVIAESALNDPRLVAAQEVSGFGLDAHWSDDFHHAVHTYLTGERASYYEDFGLLSQIAKALSHPYVFDGSYSNFRKRKYGRPAIGLTADRFVVCIQNHDQVGNRMKGDRLGQLVSTGYLKVAAALLITSPFVPLLFQGEEWSASNPFQYFTDHQEPELARAVREGRRNEFRHQSGDEVPDPQAQQTFERSKLNWQERDRGQHREMLEWYRSLIALRRDVPALRSPRLEQVEVAFEESAKWLRVRRGDIVVVFNMSKTRQRVPIGCAGRPTSMVLWSANDITVGTDGVDLPPASVAILREGFSSGTTSGP